MRKIKLARLRRKNKSGIKDDHQQNKNNVKKKGKVKNKVKNGKSDAFKDRFLIEYKKEQKEFKEYQRGINKIGKRRLDEDNDNDDLEIKKLEKKLKLNKRKSKGVPKSFISDGLDYLLDICDEETRKIVVGTEKNILGEISDSDESFSDDTASKKKIKTKPKHNLDDSDITNEDLESDNMILDINEESDISEDEDFDDDEFAEEELSGEDKLNEEVCDEEDSYDNLNTKITNLKKKQYSNIKNNKFNKVKNQKTNKKKGKNEENFSEEDETEVIEDENKKESTNTKKNKDGIWEDIYGRKRDVYGNIIIENVGKYIPPAARLKQSNDNTKNEHFLRLKRQLKGLMNRLSENNMHSIASQMEELYMSNSRNEMNEVLSLLTMEALVSPILKPERLIMEHVMLITILHTNIGTEVGAHFLQQLIEKYDSILKSNPSVENKELDCIILILSHLYNFRVVGSKLLYQILNQLSNNFTEKEVELILLILKSIGFSLRKDDPAALKQLILNLQEKALSAKSNNLRVKFMLETLLAIKNNNINKIPQYDPTHIEHLKKILKGFLRKGNNVSPFEIGLTDLLNAHEKGRWWIVGSAWSGKEDLKNNPIVKEETQFLSQKLLELARKQRMNTDSRRNIFCILMSAEDYMDAFEKLHRLGLKGQQSRDIVYVIMDCCLQEKKFNPYYAVLAQKFCDFDRKYQIAIQYALWDKLKELHNCSKQQIKNLAEFLTHLFIEKGLALSVLKVIELTELDKYNMKFLRRIMINILLHENIEICLEVFARITASPKLRRFREALRLFINHFLVKNLKQNIVSEEQKQLLIQRADYVDKLLTTRGSKIIF